MVNGRGSHTARGSSIRSFIGWSIGIGLCTAIASSMGCAADEELADESELDESFRHFYPPGDFEAEYLECEEYAGVGIVPIANVIDLVPDDYVVIEAIPGFAVVVAQSASCAEISVDGCSPQPGIFAQFGVAVVPPLTPGNSDFYQLLFATDHALLAYRLGILGVNARFAPGLSYEIDPGPTLAVDVPKPYDLAFELGGPITLPDPTAPPNPTTVFNYYAQTPLFGNVLQRNVVEGIRLGEGSGVTLTAVGSDMQGIVGGATLMFPFFSSPETFDEADVLVETHAF